MLNGARFLILSHILIKTKKMKKVFLSLLILSAMLTTAWAQDNQDLPEFQLKQSEVEAHLRFFGFRRAPGP
jgi:hypothetical protein